MTGFENPGDGEFLRQNDIAEFVDSGFLFVTFGILEFLNAVEDLAQIPGRINRQLVADVDLQFARDVNAEHDRLAVEIEFALLNEFAQRHHILLLFRINTANQRSEPPVLEFDNDRTLHIRRRRDHAGNMVDLGFQRAPVAQDIFARDQNMGVEIDDLLPQLTIEPSHYRNDENQHSDAERDAQNRDQRDDGKEGAFRFEITQRQEKAERQFQIA